jgi:hypothetical protein
VPKCILAAVGAGLGIQAEDLFSPDRIRCYGGCHGADERRVFSELCEIVDEVTGEAASVSALALHAS